MNRSNSRGLSLLEALITVGLIGLTLAITAGVMRGYSRSFQALDTNSLEMQAQMAVLQDIRSEAMSAVHFHTPSAVGASWSNNLEFSKVDLAVPSRLTVFPVDWTPHDLSSTALSNDFLVTIQYRENGGRLQRGVRKATGGSFSYSTVPPADLSSLQSRLNMDNTFELRLTFPGPHGSRTVSSKTMRRIP